MTKKISIWLALFLLILACAITFQLTVIFGGAFAREDGDPEITTGAAVTTDAPVDPSATSAVNPPVEDPSAEPTLEEQIKERTSEKIAELAALYARYYVGELDVDDLVEGVAEGFVAYAGDKYGAYHPIEEYKELTTSYSGEFAGIGVSVVYNSEYGAIEILSVMPNSPALEENLRPNDLIVAVEGEAVATLGYNTAVNRIRGAIDTDVTLTIARGENYEKMFDVTLTRRKVEEQSVIYEEIELAGRFFPVAHIRILDFNDKTAQQFAEAIGEGQTNHVSGYIFDLRNNGGGELSSIVQILDMLLPEGPIVRIQYKDGTEKVYESDKNCLKEPMVVLTNGNTASAAELFVAGLRDYNKASVVGETTYGKGTVQSIIKLRDGAALRISTSMYAPPFSDNYEGVGIKPDVEVSLAEEHKYVNLFKLEYADDTQLQMAVKLFQ
ncbi:MAG: PDZ domain-containing protein, partial [Clostridia bacterium]|nr:PDZ domain-containing protein [Clostridia bacterium]